MRWRAASVPGPACPPGVLLPRLWGTWHDVLSSGFVDTCEDREPLSPYGSPGPQQSLSTTAPTLGLVPWEVVPVRSWSRAETSLPNDEVGWASLRGHTPPLREAPGAGQPQKRP